MSLTRNASCTFCKGPWVFFLGTVSLALVSLFLDSLPGMIPLNDTSLELEVMMNLNHFNLCSNEFLTICFFCVAYIT